MSGENAFLLSCLPGLWSIDDEPPMKLRDLVEICTGKSRELVEAIALGDDLMQREAILQGETGEFEPAVLEEAQMTGEVPLPSYLVQDPHLVQSDGVWEAWFRFMADHPARCAFSDAYVCFEVALRNALVKARAKALELDPTEYIIANELGQEFNFDSVVAEWTQAPNPLAGQRVLDLARWRFTVENDAWFTFDDDELAVYAVRLLLTQRWHRLAKAELASKANAETNLLVMDGKSQP